MNNNLDSEGQKNDTQKLTSEYIEGLIDEAKAGDSESGKELLGMVAHTILSKEFNWQILEHHALCLIRHTGQKDKGIIPIDEALNIKEPNNKGGRPKLYDHKLAALDVILRRCAELEKESATTWLIKNIDPYIQRKNMYSLRVEYSAFEDMDIRLLVSIGDFCDAVRYKLEEVLPQKTL